MDTASAASAEAASLYQPLLAKHRQAIDMGGVLAHAMFPWTMPTNMMTMRGGDLVAKMANHRVGSQGRCRMPAVPDTHPVLLGGGRQGAAQELLFLAGRTPGLGPPPKPLWLRPGNGTPPMGGGNYGGGRQAPWGGGGARSPSAAGPSRATPSPAPR